MKVMFIVYHDIRTNARSQEILECAKRLGDDTIFVSYSKPFNDFGCKCILTGKGKRDYFTFIRDSIKAIKVENPNIVILHDNYTAAILRWLHKRRKNIYVIYDSSELYIDRKYKSLKMIIANHMKYFEKKYLRYANIVIAANIERANIMKEYFELNETPLVFDNMRRIHDNYDVLECNKKYGHLFSDDTFCIVYAGGIRKPRMTFELAEAVGNLGYDYRLVVVGPSNDAEKKQFYSLIKGRSFNNVFYLGFIPRNEWRYMLNRANISVSVFAQDTVNNINCASGKLYESLFEGTPILTSENPPLKLICNEFKVGVSNNCFEKGILELNHNFNFYCKNVQTYIKTLNTKERIYTLIKIINEKIKLDIGVG